MMNSGRGTMGSAVGDGRRALSKEVLVGYKRTEMEVFGAKVEGHLKRMGLGAVR